MTNKIDISSTALEKSIDIAKQFLDKLVSPAVEEAGLLLRDSVAMWKFRNQVRILNKAKSYCEKNNISPKVISLKLLCPLLDGAALEEDVALQDKWSILLSNMIDSEQNIRNHVFPYILGQISTNEFMFLEKAFKDKNERVRLLLEELYHFRAERPSIESGLKDNIKGLSAQIEEQKQTSQKRWSSEMLDLENKKRNLEWELQSLKYRESSIFNKLKTPQILPEGDIRDFELSNIIRLGLVKSVQETYANSKTLEIPRHSSYEEYLKVDIEIEVESENSHILTELGELFIEACTEKSEKYNQAK